MLAAYVDGESPAADCDIVRAHVDACPSCRDRVAGERAAKDALHARRSSFQASAPEALKARCAAYAAQRRTGSAGPDRVTARSAPRIPAVAHRKPPLLQWAPLSLAATLLLAVATVFGFGLTEKAQALAFQTTIDHVKCSRFNAGRTPADADDVARQWQSRFGWAISPPESSKESGLELRAVRRCGVMDGRVAHLMYEWLGEPLSVYVLPKRTVGEATQVVRRFRHNSIIWSKNDRTYIMVTPHRRDPSLDAMVAYVRATAY
jgi:anti-sigma factor RsiW